MQLVTSLKVTLYEHRSIIKVNSFFPSGSMVFYMAPDGNRYACCATAFMIRSS